MFLLRRAISSSLLLDTHQAVAKRIQTFVARRRRAAVDTVNLLKDPLGGSGAIEALVNLGIGQGEQL